MAKGAIAKEAVEKKIIEAFGADYITTVDKKIYVYGNEGGEKVQIAISLTCPKVPIEVGNAAPTVSAPLNVGGGLNFESPDYGKKQETVITEDEMQNVADLMRRLGL